MVTKKDETPDVADEAEGQPTVEVEEDVEVDEVDEAIEVKPEGNRISLRRGPRIGCGQGRGGDHAARAADGGGLLSWGREERCWAHAAVPFRKSTSPKAGPGPR
jgi:hypothetical protein